MKDAPAYRVWPPLALGVPLAAGLAVTASLGDPVELPAWLRVVGWVLVAVFVVWNGWALIVMNRAKTALLPGGSTERIIDYGPWRVSRNPLYLGMIALDAGLALLVPSFWAVLLVPVGVAALFWGAIQPEETYLRAKFGAEYTDYARRVRRWV